MLHSWRCRFVACCADILIDSCSAQFLDPADGAKPDTAKKPVDWYAIGAASFYTSMGAWIALHTCSEIDSMSFAQPRSSTHSAVVFSFPMNAKVFCSTVFALRLHAAMRTHLRPTALDTFILSSSVFADALPAAWNAFMFCPSMWTQRSTPAIPASASYISMRAN